MAQNHRLPEPDNAEAAMIVVMQIRAANAAGGKPDRNLAWTRLFLGMRLDAQVAGLMNDDCTHGNSSENGVRRSALSSASK